MKDKGRMLFRAIAVALSLAVLAPGAWKAAQAGDTTKVSGTVTDASGKPLEKVEIWFENAKIAGKRVGPVKTSKKGKYIYPYLDVGIEPEWRVIPKLEGYLVLRMNWKLIDSQRNDRGSNTDTILNAKQEIPSLHPVLVGDSGVNEVNFVMVKEAEFNNAVRQAVTGKHGGSAAPAAATGTAPEAAAAGAPAAAGAAAPAPAAAPPTSSHTVTEAVDLIKAGKNEEAIPILKEFLEKSPENAPIQFTLGKAYINAKQYDAAVAPLQKSLQLKPDQPGAHFYLGIAYSQMGQDADALKEFEAEIPISPEQDSAYSNAASLYDKAGNTDKALEYYKKAVEIAPQRPELHASLANIYEKKGDKASAQAEYKALADADPGRAAVTWYNVGAIAKNGDKNDEAVKAFQKAIELDPSYAIAHRELGYALVKQGDFKGAVAQFTKYLELAPKAADAGEIKVMAKQLSQ
ncbi:MAG TPA: tetratricopeptide repeat protein [Candidatus Polarisedimenticolia bacterium]|nr:tetratricopeptide repeat protein [Candidatus Polarisedimenticolia bacterium]